jgi:hypothetical protein
MRTPEGPRVFENAEVLPNGMRAYAGAYDITPQMQRAINFATRRGVPLNMGELQKLAENKKAQEAFVQEEADIGLAQIWGSQPMTQTDRLYAQQLRNGYGELKKAVTSGNLSSERAYVLAQELQRRLGPVAAHEEADKQREHNMRMQQQAQQMGDWAQLDKLKMEAVGHNALHLPTEGGIATIISSPDGKFHVLEPKDREQTIHGGGATAATAQATNAATAATANTPNFLHMSDAEFERVLPKVHPSMSPAQVKQVVDQQKAMRDERRKYQQHEADMDLKHELAADKSIRNRFTEWWRVTQARRLETDPEKRAAMESVPDIPERFKTEEGRQAAIQERVYAARFARRHGRDPNAEELDSLVSSGGAFLSPQQMQARREVSQAMQGIPLTPGATATRPAAGGRPTTIGDLQTQQMLANPQRQALAQAHEILGRHPDSWTAGERAHIQNLRLPRSGESGDSPGAAAPAPTAPTPASPVTPAAPTRTVPAQTPPPTAAVAHETQPPFREEPHTEQQRSVLANFQRQRDATMKPLGGSTENAGIGGIRGAREFSHFERAHLQTMIGQMETLFRQYGSYEAMTPYDQEKYIRLRNEVQAGLEGKPMRLPLRGPSADPGWGILSLGTPPSGNES